MDFLKNYIFKQTVKLKKCNKYNLIMLHMGNLVIQEAHC
jgi:hypothetical protein